MKLKRTKTQEELNVIQLRKGVCPLESKWSFNDFQVVLKFIKTFIILLLGVLIVTLSIAAVLHACERIVGPSGVFVVLIVLILLLIMWVSYSIVCNE